MTTPAWGATLKEFFSREGYRVEVAQSAEQALALHTARGPFSLALVDLIMPVMDGLSLTVELHRRDPDIAVVIMTGYGPSRRRSRPSRKVRKTTSLSRSTMKPCRRRSRG